MSKRKTNSTEMRDRIIQALIGLLLFAGAAWLFWRMGSQPRTPPEEPKPAPIVQPTTTGSAEPGLTPASSAGYAAARPDYPWSFPRDTGAHPRYQTEWWYYTGHLVGPQGERFGYELTFFRYALSPQASPRASAWAMNQLYFAHFAVTDAGGRRFLFTDAAARGALGLAGASTTGQNVWLRRWFARREGNVQRLFAEGGGARLELRNTPVKPPVLHGENGYSQKGEGREHASQYTSYTRMKSAGTLTLNGAPLAVTGESWMDHEFASQSLAPNEAGWDWFSLQLATGEDVMLYRMRRQDGSTDPYSGGTWVEADGTSSRLALSDYQIEELGRWTSPRTGTTYPAKWRVALPRRGLDLTLTPLLADQELTTAKSTGVTYWEGAVDVEGTRNGQPLRGRGYVELTGYGGGLAGKA